MLYLICPSILLGHVTWKEYHMNFMIEQGFNKSYAVKHPENHRQLKRKGKQISLVLLLIYMHIFDFMTKLTVK